MLQNHYLRRIYKSKFWIFAVGGGLGAVINWILSFTLTTFLGVYYLISYTLAQTVNITFNFLWNRHVTFKITSHARKRFIKFVIVSLSTATFSIAFVYAIKEFVIDYLYMIVIFGQELNYLVAIVIATFVVAVINYLLNKLWVFNVK